MMWTPGDTDKRTRLSVAAEAGVGPTDKRVRLSVPPSRRPVSYGGARRVPGPRETLGSARFGPRGPDVVLEREDEVAHLVPVESHVPLGPVVNAVGADAVEE